MSNFRSPLTRLSVPELFALAVDASNSLVAGVSNPSTTTLCNSDGVQLGGSIVAMDGGGRGKRSG